MMEDRTRPPVSPDGPDSRQGDRVETWHVDSEPPLPPDVPESRPASRSRFLSSRRVVAAFLLAGALGCVCIGARQAGWLDSFGPAPQWETGVRPPDEGPPGSSPADEMDAGDLPLGLKERAAYPDELLTLLAAPELQRVGAQAASPDGRWLVVASENMIRVWRVGNAPAAVKLENHPGPVAALTFTPDSKTLLAGGGNGPDRDRGGWLQTWRLDNDAFVAGESWAGPLDVYALALAGDGETLAVGGMSCVPNRGSEGPHLRLGKFRASTSRASNWSQEFNLPDALEGGRFPVRALAFSPDGKTLASATGNTVRLWALGQPHVAAWVPWTLAALLGLAGVGLLAGRHLGAGRRGRAVFYLGGGLVAVGVLVCLVTAWVGLGSRGTHVWTELYSPGGPVRALAFAEGGGTLAVAGSGLLLWDVRRPQPIKLPALPGMSGAVASVAFAPGGPWLFTVGASGEVAVAHTGAGSVVRRCPSSSSDGGGLAILGGRHVAVPRAGKVVLLRLWSRDGSEKTLAACAEALAKNPRDVGALVLRAQIHLRHGRAHRAVPDLDAAIVADKKCKEAYWLRGLLRARADEHRGALEDLNMVIQLDPKDALAHYQRGLLQVRLKSYAEAQRSLDRAFQLNEKLADQYKKP
jgi:WD40 repeat protein